jgi:WbqC-like protein family
VTARAPQRTAIVQSNYIPWKGYFDLMNAVDAFVLLDDVQYTRRDWRNRNRIKTALGTRWLSIPVQTRGRYEQRIDETRIADERWARVHWSAIESAYGSAPHFDLIASRLAPLYATLRDAELLTEINSAFLLALRDALGIDTPISRSTDYPTAGGRDQRLLDICLATGATQYVSGPLARDYLDVELFERAGVEVVWFDYSGYRPYAQLHGAFEHPVSVVDLLCCEGGESREYLKTTAAEAVEAR